MLMMFWSITPMQVASFYKNQQIYKMLQAKAQEMPEELPIKKRHLWFYGAKTGKTYKIREMMKQTGFKWFHIPTNNDWIGYSGQRYFDEFKGQLSVQQLNAICDGNYKVNTKGGSVENNILETLYNRFIEKELLIKYNL